MVELGPQFMLFLSCLLHRIIFSLVHRPSSSVIKNWRQGRPGNEDLQLLQNEFFQCTYVGYCFFLQMSSGADHYSWDILRGLRMHIRQFYDGVLDHIDHKKTSTLSGPLHIWFSLARAQKIWVWGYSTQTHIYVRTWSLVSLSMAFSSCSKSAIAVAPSASNIRILSPRALRQPWR